MRWIGAAVLAVLLVCGLSREARAVPVIEDFIFSIDKCSDNYELLVAQSRNPNKKFVCTDFTTCAFTLSCGNRHALFLNGARRPIIFSRGATQFADKSICLGCTACFPSETFAFAVIDTCNNQFVPFVAKTSTACNFTVGHRAVTFCEPCKVCGQNLTPISYQVAEATFAAGQTQGSFTFNFFTADPVKGSFGVTLTPNLAAPEFDAAGAAPAIALLSGLLLATTKRRTTAAG